MNHFIEIAQVEDGWQTAYPGRSRFGYRRLADAQRRADELVERNDSTSGWRYSDEFMLEAAHLAQWRTDLREQQVELARRTDDAVRDLAMQGLTPGDIAAALGVSSERVSQLLRSTAEWMWGEDNEGGEVEYVKLQLDRGWKMGRGRGPRPDVIEWAGRQFEPTGMGGSVGNQPTRWTYVQRRAEGQG